MKSANTTSLERSSPARPPNPVQALFDESHGQANWRQTGFTSRLRTTNFAGVAQLLRRLGLRCTSTARKPLEPFYPATRLLVIPPPTGTYHTARERWQPDRASLFTSDELSHILRFVQDGGRLLAFSYRFGDSFTQTNLRDLFSPLRCHLNDDAVVDLEQVRKIHPLKSRFTTSRERLPFSWSTDGVHRVQWRSMATFTLLPGAEVQPLVYSPGGSCLSFNRTHRQISFHSLPIAVAGLLGAGRFVLFGGPHAFETGTFGLLEAADNRRFLQNVLHWLLARDALPFLAPEPVLDHAHLHLSNPYWDELCRIEGQGKGEQLVALVERVLRKTGTLKALNRARWAP